MYILYALKVTPCLATERKVRNPHDIFFLFHFEGNRNPADRGSVGDSRFGLYMAVAHLDIGWKHLLLHIAQPTATGGKKHVFCFHTRFSLFHLSNLIAALV